MDARCKKILLAVAALASVAATKNTRNFNVTAPTPEIAVQVAEAAEYYRKEIAIDWLGQELPAWGAPCPIHVKVGQIGAGGATSFNFDRGEVFGWNMNIQGSLERILDSVLPHEISHTIFACYFRRPLPRWADEGAATLAEHESEKRRQVLTVRQILGTQKRIPLKTLVAMKDYPPDMQDVLTLYAEGYSLAELLVQQGGKARYLAFLQDSHERGWDTAIKTHYGYQGVDGLEKNWHQWVLAGSPAINLPAGNEFASAAKEPAQSSKSLKSTPMIRAQNADEDQTLNANAVASAAPMQLPRSNLKAPAPRSRTMTQQAYAPPEAPAAQAHAYAAQDYPSQSFQGQPAAPRSAGVAVASAQGGGKRRNKGRRNQQANPDLAVDLGEAADPSAGQPAAGEAAATEEPALVLEPTDNAPASDETDDARLAAPKQPAKRKPTAAKTLPMSNRPRPVERDEEPQPEVATDLDTTLPETAPRSFSKPRRSNARTVSNGSNDQLAGKPTRSRRRTPQWSEFPQDQRPLPSSLRARTEN